MTELDLSYWESGAGAALIDEIERFCGAGGDVSAAILVLQKRGIATSEKLREAAEFAKARSRAVRKFGSDASRGLFTLLGVEQASRPEIAKLHASRFSGCSRVLEIGAGLGTDTIELAACVGEVVSVESDPRTAALLSTRLRAKGITNVQVLIGPIEGLLDEEVQGDFDGLFADPARRTVDGGRARRSEEYSPSLPWLLEEVASTITGPIGIKVAPGLSHDELPEGWAFEMLGIRDECLEQTWWCNSAVVSGTARLVDIGAVWTPENNAVTADSWSGEIPVGAYIVEPHAALIRTGCLDEFFCARGIQPIAPDIAYGVTTAPPEPSPWYRAFHILEVMPYTLRRVERAVTERVWSEVEVKKRGVALDVDAIAKKLMRVRRPGGERGVVLLTRREGKPLVILAKRFEGGVL